MTPIAALPLLATVTWQLDPVPTKDAVGPGVVYGLLVFGLVAATVLLWLSLRKQLRRVRFEERDGSETGRAGAEPAPDAGSPTKACPDR